MEILVRVVGVEVAQMLAIPVVMMGGLDDHPLSMRP
jgi:hypothetical protein